MQAFKLRSSEKELLDRTDIPFPEIMQNMKELDVINTRLGGHAITLKGFTHLLKKRTDTTTVLEIGCGGGDNLRVIRNWCKKNDQPVSLTGVDINPECIAYARSLYHNNGINFIVSDYRKIDSVHDVIFSSLFCHHFSDEELAGMMQWMKAHSRVGFFINDLHRHPLAYYSIKFLTKAFSKSRLVKNDAPLSVRRGFKKADWQRIFAAAGIKNYTIKWCWAFRWLISFEH